MSTYTPIDDTTVEAGKIVSVEFFQALANNINYLCDSMPVGSVISVCVGLSGVPTPDSSIWEECSGGIVSNPNSPIHGQAKPNLKEAFIKCPTTEGQSGLTGGSNTVAATHNHGGVLKFDTPGINQDGDTDDDRWDTHGSGHYHTIDSDLSSYINVEPRRILIKHFIKVM